MVISTVLNRDYSHQVILYRSDVMAASSECKIRARI